MNSEQERIQKIAEKIDSKSGWKYKEIAEKTGLTPVEAERFTKVMRDRFDQETQNGGYMKEGKAYHLSYTIEWAFRVKDGVAYNSADRETAKALAEAGFPEGEYGKCRYNYEVDN